MIEALRVAERCARISAKQGDVGSSEARPPTLPAAIL
jgi:hypothetical protein